MKSHQRERAENTKERRNNCLRNFGGSSMVIQAREGAELWEGG